MRSILLFVLTAIALPLRAESVAFVNVNVLPMTTDAVYAAQTVIVVDGRITEVGPVDAIPIPKHAQVIDGTDKGRTS